MPALRVDEIQRRTGEVQRAISRRLVERRQRARRIEIGPASVEEALAQTIALTVAAQQTLATMPEDENLRAFVRIAVTDIMAEWQRQQGRDAPAIVGIDGAPLASPPAEPDPVD